MELEEPLNPINEQNSEERSNINTTQDSFNITLFYLLGIGSHLTYYLFLNCVDILNSYCNIKSAGIIINRTVPLSFSVSSIIMSLFRPRNPIHYMTVGLILLTSITIAYPILLLTISIGKTLEVITIIFLLVIGFAEVLTYYHAEQIATSISFSSILYLYNGCNFCGMLAACLRISTKSSFDDSQIVTSTICYFYMSVAFLLIVTIYAISKVNLDGIKNKFQNSHGFYCLRIFSIQAFELVKTHWTFLVATCLNSMITISLFPGYIMRVLEHPSLGNWTFVVVSSIFCIFNLIGQSIAVRIPLISRFFVLWLALSRLIWYPVFIVAIENIADLGEPVWTLCWLILFAATNGIVHSHSEKHCFINSNVASVINEEQISTSGYYLLYFWMKFMRSIGYAGGVFLTLLYRK